MNVSTGHIAFIDYELIGPENQTIYAEEMFPYIHGETELLSGMKKALQGKAVGDNIDVKMSPIDAFGEIVPFKPIDVHILRSFKSVCVLVTLINNSKLESYLPVDDMGRTTLQPAEVWLYDVVIS